MSYTADELVRSKYNIIMSAKAGVCVDSTLESIKYKLEVMRRGSREIQSQVSLLDQIDVLSDALLSYFSRVS